MNTKFADPCKNSHLLRTFNFKCKYYRARHLHISASFELYSIPAHTSI